MTKNELIEQALIESKDFSKEIRQYLYDQSQKRELTEEEKKLFDKTHDIHIDTNDALMIFTGQV